MGRGLLIFVRFLIKGVFTWIPEEVGQGIFLLRNYYITKDLANTSSSFSFL
jgi:hypothetical protein